MLREGRKRASFNLITVAAGATLFQSTEEKPMEGRNLRARVFARPSFPNGAHSQPTEVKSGGVSSEGRRVHFGEMEFKDFSALPQVPEGHLKVARRFIAGIFQNRNARPSGDLCEMIEGRVGWRRR